MLEQHSYLLQNQMNPFPISGQLKLSDAGELSFRLDEKAAQASLGWLEKATGISGLKESIQGGERPVVFSLRISDHKVSWPKTLGGYAMRSAQRIATGSSASTTPRAAVCGRRST